VADEQAMQLFIEQAKHDEPLLYYPFGQLFMQNPFPRLSTT